MAEFAIIDDKPIRVTADGRWLHGDTSLHPRVEALFERSVVPAASSAMGSPCPAGSHPDTIHVLAMRMEMEGDRAWLPMAGERFPVGPFDRLPTH